MLVPLAQHLRDLHSSELSLIQTPDRFRDPTEVSDQFHTRHGGEVDLIDLSGNVLSHSSTPILLCVCDEPLINLHL